MSRRLAVALPVRNGENFLRPAIESILSQSFTDFDLFVSDNASTDSTGAILAEYVLRDPRVKVSRSATMLPLGDNMNRAMDIADAKWVKLFCHDDVMRRDCLQQINSALDAAEGTNIGLIGNGDTHLFANGYETPGIAGGETLIVGGKVAVRQFLDGTNAWTMPAVTTATVRKDVFERIGRFDPRFDHFDHFCWLRLMPIADLLYLPATLTAVRVHPGQVTHESRRSLRWTSDYQTFIVEYLAEYGAVLHLPLRTILRARLKPINIAAKSLAVEVHRRQWRSAGAMLRKLSPFWWPALPPLVLRSLRHERRGAASVAGHVPQHLL